jgi:anti-sigma B factor antagonist
MRTQTFLLQDDPPCLQVLLERVDGVPVVHLCGEVDMVSYEHSAKSIRRVLSGRPAAMVLDLLPVTYFGSSGLQLLVDARDKVRETRTDVHLAANRIAVRPMEIVGLAEVFPLHRTVDDALAAARQAA